MAENDCSKAFHPACGMDVVWLHQTIANMLDEGLGYLDVMTHLAADLHTILCAASGHALRILRRSGVELMPSGLHMSTKKSLNVELHEYYTAQVAERYDMIKRGWPTMTCSPVSLLLRVTMAANSHAVVRLHHDGGRWR